MNKIVIIGALIAMVVFLPLASAQNGLNSNVYNVNEFSNPGSNSATISITYANATYEYAHAQVQVLSSGNVVYNQNFTGETQFSVFNYPIITVIITVGNSIVFNEVFTNQQSSSSISSVWPVSATAIFGIIAAWFGRGYYDVKKNKTLEGEISNGNAETEESKRFMLSLSEDQKAQESMAHYEELDKKYREFYHITDKVAISKIFETELEEEKR